MVLPGDSFGQEFVYAESQAKRIATRAKRNIVTTEDRLEPMMRDRTATRDSQPPTDFESARIYALGLQGRRDNIESAFTENQSLDKQEVAGGAEATRAVPERGG